MIGAHRLEAVLRVFVRRGLPVVAATPGVVLVVGIHGLVLPGLLLGIPPGRGAGVELGVIRRADGLVIVLRSVRPVIGVVRRVRIGVFVLSRRRLVRGIGVRPGER